MVAQITAKYPAVVLERVTEPLDEAPADEAGGEMVKSLPDIGAAFVADSEAAVASEPSKCAFDMR